MTTPRVRFSAVSLYFFWSVLLTLGTTYSIPKLPKVMHDFRKIFWVYNHDSLKFLYLFLSNVGFLLLRVDIWVASHSIFDLLQIFKSALRFNLTFSEDFGRNGYSSFLQRQERTRLIWNEAFALVCCPFTLIMVASTVPIYVLF